MKKQVYNMPKKRIVVRRRALKAKGCGCGGGGEGKTPCTCGGNDKKKKKKTHAASKASGSGIQTRTLTEMERLKLVRERRGVKEPCKLPDRTIGPVKVDERKPKKDLDSCGGPFKNILPGIVFMLGSTRAGKTTAAVNFMTRDDFFGGLVDRIYVVSKQIEVDPTYQPLLEMDNVFVETEFNKKLENDIINYVRESRLKGEDKRVGLMVDDAIFGDAGRKGNAIQSFGSVARHWVDYMLMLGQDLRASAVPKLRNQFRAYYVAKNTPMVDRQKLFGELGEEFGGAENMEELFQYSTRAIGSEGDKYRFMFINLPMGTVWSGLNECIYQRDKES